MFAYEPLLALGLTDWNSTSKMFGRRLAAAAVDDMTLEHSAIVPAHPSRTAQLASRAAGPFRNSRDKLSTSI